MRNRRAKAQGPSGKTTISRKAEWSTHLNLASKPKIEVFLAIFWVEDILVRSLETRRKAR